jgi:hypothetical protein
MPSEVRKAAAEAVILRPSGFEPDEEAIGMRQDEKDPSWWGPSWGLIPHGRGGLGDGERPAFVEFEPGNFLRLYQTAHSASTVDKWELCLQAGRGRQS